MQQAISPKRPLGVSIIAVLVAIQAVVLLLLGLLSLFLVVLPGWTASAGGPTGARLVALAVGLLFLFFGAVSFFLAYGLWTLKRWAFLWVVIVEGASVIFGIVGFLLGSRGEPSIWGLILPIVILLYFLLDKNVRAAFRV